RSPPLSSAHQRLEGPAEHLGIHRRFRPAGGFFARGEPILREHRVEELAVRLVRKRDRAIATLERSTREKAAVQKRNSTERACLDGAVSDRRIERAEKQSPERAIVEPSAAHHAPIELMPDERQIAVEPTLGFEKRQKEQPRRVEKS